MRRQLNSAGRQPGSTPAMHGVCPRSLRFLSFLLLASLCGWSAPASSAQPKHPAPGLPTLTTAFQAHNLSSAEAARAYPIHLRAVVTYFDPDLGNGFAAMFVHDATGGIWVNLPANTIASLAPGTLVDLTGVSGNGLFAPIVASPHVRVIGPSHLPEDALRVNHATLFSGVDDSQWVEVGGTVHSSSEAGRTVTLHLAMPDGPVNVMMPREPGADYAKLVDARVLIRANAAPIFSRVKYQMVGMRLMAPGLQAVKVLEAAPSDPFNLPAAPVDSLMRWDHISLLKHRVHLHGIVTLFWPGSSLCIRDDSGSICTQTAQETPLAVGQPADLVGFAAIRGDAHILTDVVYRPAGQGRPLVPEPITADDILHGLHDSELIVIDGQLIGIDRASSDATLSLSTGKVVFSAVLPNQLMGPGADRWQIGSKVRVTGICAVSLNADSSAVGEGVAEGQEVAKSFRVLMRSPADVVVLQKASWWTPLHALVLLAFVLAGTLLVLAWVIALRKRVELQARLLRASEERFRHLALHDALTGLASRLLFQDRLNAALLTVQRRQSGLALIMLDIDKFKQINDTYGHLAGDEVLRISAARLLELVRKSDTVARMGGDEFVVLLTDLNDAAIAEKIAAGIVEKLAVPVSFTGTDLPVSVSVGVCTGFEADLDADTLLKNADTALYQAKASGRNRFRLFAPETVSTGTE